MLKPTGYGRYIGKPSVGEQEHDTFTCAHCNCIVIVKPLCDPASAGGHCKVCDGLLCPQCVGKGCKPFEKKLQEMEMKHIERRRSYGG